jgi:hypothetical protein
MCTLTVIAIVHRGYRVAINRDGLRQPGGGAKPQAVRCGDFNTLVLCDPLSGSSAFGVNEIGLSAFIMPRFLEPNTPSCMQGERPGMHLQKILSCPSLIKAENSVLEHLDPERSTPFSVVLLEGRNISLFQSNGLKMNLTRMTTVRPFFLTTSDLGDAQVEDPRKDLFDALLRKLPNGQKQDRYHAHQWPSQPHISVNMERADMRTISWNVLTVNAEEASFFHHEGPPHRDGSSLERVLKRPIALAR